MVNGASGVNGGSNAYNMYMSLSKKMKDENQYDAEQVTTDADLEKAQVDPSEVMAFLEANNIFVKPQNTVTTPAGLDQATQDRVAGYMEQFEMIYGIVAKEFGEENAPMIMDFVMDSLMGMVA